MELRLSKISLSAFKSPEPMDGFGSNLIYNISAIVLRTDYILVTLTQF